MTRRFALALAATAAGCAVRAPQIEPPPPRAEYQASWRNTFSDTAFAPDSTACSTTAQQLAGSATGTVVDQEFDRCIRAKFWVRVAVFPEQAFPCDPVKVDWIAALPQPLVDSSFAPRFAAEMNRRFLVDTALRGQRARISFAAHVNVNGVDLRDMRIVSGTGDYSTTSGLERGLGAYLPGLRHLTREEYRLMGVAAIETQCARVFLLGRRFF